MYSGHSPLIGHGLCLLALTLPIMPAGCAARERHVGAVRGASGKEPRQQAAQLMVRMAVRMMVIVRHHSHPFKLLAI